MEYDVSKIPRLLDEQFSLKGATRISKRGEADASGDFEKTWEDWRAQLWLDLKMIYSLTIHENVLPKQENNSIQIIRDEVTTSLAFMHGAALATVVKMKNCKVWKVNVVHAISR